MFHVLVSNVEAKYTDNPFFHLTASWGFINEDNHVRSVSDQFLRRGADRNIYTMNGAELVD